MSPHTQGTSRSCCSASWSPQLLLSLLSTLPQHPWGSSQNGTRVMSVSCSYPPVVPILLSMAGPASWPPCTLLPPSLPPHTCLTTHSSSPLSQAFFPILESSHILLPLLGILCHAFGLPHSGSSFNFVSLKRPL